MEGLDGRAAGSGDLRQYFFPETVKSRTDARSTGGSQVRAAAGPDFPSRGIMV
jgi:hypothetical protein